jgi:hypothetical protein
MNTISWIKDNIKITDIISVNSQGTSDCPFCGKRSKWFTSQDRAGSCYSPSCPSNANKTKMKDVIDVYALHHNCTTGEAIRFLSKGYTTTFKPNNEYFEFNVQLAKFYHNTLLNNTEALAYLNKRGITEYLIRAFQIGFAPKDIKQYKGIDLDNLKKFSLLKENNYLYFNDRIIFPIRDINKNIIHFQGRYIYDIPLDDNGEEKFPKYLSTKAYKNYPNIVAYLYLEDRLSSYDKNKSLFITEGIPDCLSLIKNGLQAVALFGLSGLNNHSTKIEDFNTIYICADNDISLNISTGEKEYKSWKMLLPQIKQLQMLLPNTTIKLFKPPYVIANHPVKDMNDFIEVNYFTKDKLLEYIENNSVDYLYKYITNNLKDRTKHLDILTMCKLTNRGLDIMQKYLVDNNLINLEYIISLL